MFGSNMQRSLLALAVSAGLFPLQASAQQASDKDTVLSTVVVSGDQESKAHEAERRTITGKTSLSAKELERLDIRSSVEATTFSPNVYQPKASFSNGNSNYIIRGIGETDGQIVPSTATFVDGVYLTRQLGSVQELLDIERVDVERGPVGFDGGRYVEGGAVRFTTRVPTEQTRQSYEIGYGTDNEYRVGGYVSGELVEDKLFGSLALARHARDGLEKNTSTGSEANDISWTGGRAKLRVLPQDDLEINFTVDGSYDDSKNRGFSNLLAADKYAVSNPVDADSDFYTAGFSTNILYTLNEHLTLSSLTSARHFKQDGYYDNFGDLYGRNASAAVYRDTAYQQEFKLQGQYERFDFSTGLYYLKEFWEQDRRANSIATTNLTNPAASTTRLFDVYNKQNTTDYGLFGKVNYKITPRLTGTLGLRFEHEIYTNNPSMYGPASGTTRAYPQSLDDFYNAPVGPLAWSASATDRSDRLLPEVGVSYALTPEVSVYASYRQGARQGGFDFNTNTTSNILQSTLAYEPEILTTYEAGIKSFFPAHNLTLNLGVFYNEFKDIQLSTTDPVNGFSRRWNVGEAHSEGIELEARWSPTDALSILYSASYLNSRLDQFDGVESRTTLKDGSVINNTAFEGAELPYSPKFQTALGFDYRLPIATASKWRIGADASYQSEMHTSIQNIAVTQLKPQTLVNARLNWTSADDHWAVQLSAKNLLDKRYSQRISLQQSGGTPYLMPTFYNDPRSVFVSLKYNY
ncbi:TonB-dependent receptor [Pseudomonas sp. LRF_L74]|uniref:TonB-dependent receptor n=1 Tax=Pseudomonas sp. LRF_L74 TaxID=3369422 RepID=UPI003F63EB3E